MKLILREDVENLGKGGELVEVKTGYGRNFLLPRGLAVAANPKNVRELEHQKKIAEAGPPRPGPAPRRWRSASPTRRSP